MFFGEDVLWGEFTSVSIADMGKYNSHGFGFFKTAFIMEKKAP